MPCNTCGAATQTVDSDGGTEPGESFTEEYTCANGHKGWVHGTVGKNPANWSRTGAVFESYE